jgi:hypothetical protein
MQLGAQAEAVAAALVHLQMAPPEPVVPRIQAEAEEAAGTTEQGAPEALVW